MVGSDYDVGDLPALNIAREFDIPFYKFLNVRPNIKMIKKEFDHHYTPRHHLNYLYQTDFTITKKMLQYVCLLYTSPSPRDKRQSRMPSSA